MRTLFVLFDSLNRLALGAYGGTAIPTPNFDRFAARGITFDKHYVSSLPCMPARRDMHTGRLSFLHRPWGPLEPFDNSYASLLSEHGVYSHLISDHLHYFETGGWGYASAFDSWDFVRGQEYDPIEVMTRPPVQRLRDKFDARHYPMNEFVQGETITRGTASKDAWRRSRHAINTEFMRTEDQYPTAKCFERAFDFLERNKDSDDWFLQLECFDPHEPFTAPPRFREAFKTGYSGKILDWPLYEKVSNSKEEIAEIRANYAALVAMCDEYFGKLLDWMDVNDMWKDTALILTTDHGYLLGEHEWWAKNKMPYYEEISHIPLIFWHPEHVQQSGKRISALTQTPDLMPTIMQLHGVDAPDEVTAVSLLDAMNDEQGQRQSALLGMFGGPLCITDGRYSYFHFPDDITSSAPPMYTLMPSHLETLFSIDELKSSELVDGFPFTKGAPLLRMKMSPDIGESGRECVANWPGGLSLYDLQSDPKQKRPLYDRNTVSRLKQEILKHLRRNDSPEETYPYYGLAAE
ncbi:MAG: sulfatase [Granulosicoccus sp.]